MDCYDYTMRIKHNFLGKSSAWSGGICISIWLGWTRSQHWGGPFYIEDSTQLNLIFGQPDSSWPPGAFVGVHRALGHFRSS